MSITPESEPGTTRGLFNYLAPEVSSSLFRNGQVLTRRDLDGNDSGRQGIDLREYSMPVHDARMRSSGETCRLEANGFELVARPFDAPDFDFFSHDDVVARYYPHCAALVSEWTGARAVAFDHNIRSASGQKAQRRIRGGQNVQGPAHLVHGDYTLTSGPARLRALAQTPGGNDTVRSLLAEGESLLDASDVERVVAGDGRFAIINVWRNIAPEPVASHPMALCDGQTVAPEELVVFEIHYPDRVGENYFAKHDPRHRWYYYPGMTRDEALLIKQWDSAGTLARSSGALADASDAVAPCTFSFHSAFNDPATGPDAPDRWSMEVRCIVLYD